MTVTVDRPNFPSGWDVGIPRVDCRNAQHPDAMVSLGRPPSSASRSARTLTFKEREILGLLATQLSRREIGQRLYVSLNTVKTTNAPCTASSARETGARPSAGRESSACCDELPDIPGLGSWVVARDLDNHPGEEAAGVKTAHPAA
jgi:hypothetical protein